MYDKGIHPDPTTAAECEIERLEGLLCEARGGLLRALEFNAGTPERLAIRRDVRSALERSDPDYLPPGVAAEAVAETMRWLPEEHARARAERAAFAPNPPCPGKGKCHGPVGWCEDCGSVADVCDDWQCDQHHPPQGCEDCLPYSVCRTCGRDADA